MTGRVVKCHAFEECIRFLVSPDLSKACLRMCIQIVKNHMEMFGVPMLFHTIPPEEVSGINRRSSVCDFHGSRSFEGSYRNENVNAPVSCVLIVCAERFSSGPHVPWAARRSEELLWRFIEIVNFVTFWQ